LPAPIAPLIGDELTLDAAALLPSSGPVRLDRLKLQAASVGIDGGGELDTASSTLSGRIDVTMPDFARFADMAGTPLAGKGSAHIDLAGTMTSPRATLMLDAQDIAAAGAALSRTTATIAVEPAGTDRYHVTGEGRLVGPRHAGEPGPLDSVLGETLDWTLDAEGDATGAAATLHRATVTGAGLDFTAEGTAAGSVIDGKLHLAAADLSRYAGLAGLPIAGTVALDGTVATDAAGTARADLAGRTEGLRTGIPAADALLGPQVTLAAKGSHAADGKVELPTLELTGAGLKLAGRGSADPAADRLAATARLSLPRLAPLGTALGTPLTGAIDVQATAVGRLAGPAVKVTVDGNGLGAGTTRLDRLTLTATAEDLAKRIIVVAGELSSAGLGARFGATLAQTNPAGAAPQQLAISDLKLTAPGTTVTGAVTLDRGSATGSIAARSTVTSPMPWASRRDGCRSISPISPPRVRRSPRCAWWQPPTAPAGCRSCSIRPAAPPPARPLCPSQWRSAAR
jgi:translocation and assembly module TamB